MNLTHKDRLEKHLWVHIKRAPKEIHEQQMAYANVSANLGVQYFDPNTGHFYEHLLEERPCPPCKENYESFLFFKDGGRHVKCKECDMVYLNPVFKDENLEKILPMNMTYKIRYCR